MLRRPQLSLCGDRSRTAKIHPSSGEPDAWLTPQRLRKVGLGSLSFDFFIDWTNGKVGNEIWLKRLVNESVAAPLVDDVPNGIYQCDSKESVERLCRFASVHGFTVHYFTIHDNTDWANLPRQIVETAFTGEGAVKSNAPMSLNDLKSRIQLLSGGTVRVGAKGLIYGLTSLECFLSTSDAAWPGDVDLVLFDEELAAKAMIELKKHTLETPIRDQALHNYYPHPDRRKYDRLALLARTSPDHPPPIVVLYYPTRNSIAEIKLELVGGRVGKLVSLDSQLLPLPTMKDGSKSDDLVAALAAMICDHSRSEDA